MKLASLLVVLFTALVCITQATQQPGVTQNDLFTSALNNRVWSNQFLGISWTIPKGLYSRQEQEKAMREKAQLNPQGVTELMKQFEQRDEQDRAQGILLRGDDHDPQLLGLEHGETNTARSMRTNYNTPLLGAPSPAERTFMILAQQLSDANESAAELLKAQVDQMHAQNPQLKISLAPEPAAFAGISFAHADWMRHDKSTNGQKQFFRSYVTTRNGCELAFTFRAESQKNLDKIAESMQTLAVVEFGGGRRASQ